jgi:hypothetical protein
MDIGNFCSALFPTVSGAENVSAAEASFDRVLVGRGWIPFNDREGQWHHAMVGNAEMA